MNIDYKTRYMWNRFVFMALESKPGSETRDVKPEKMEIRKMTPEQLKQELNKVNAELAKVGKAAEKIIADTKIRINKIEKRIETLENDPKKTPKKIKDLENIRKLLDDVKDSLKKEEAAPEKKDPEKKKDKPEAKEEIEKVEITKWEKERPNVSPKQKEMLKFAKITRGEAWKLNKYITANPPDIKLVNVWLKHCKERNVEMRQEGKRATRLGARALGPYLRELTAARKYLLSGIEGAEKVLKTGKPVDGLKQRKAYEVAKLTKEKGQVMSRIFSKVSPLALKNMYKSDNPKIVKNAKALYKDMLTLVRKVHGKKTMKGVSDAQDAKFFQDLTGLTNRYNALQAQNANEGEVMPEDEALGPEELDAREHHKEGQEAKAKRHVQRIKRKRARRKSEAIRNGKTPKEEEPIPEYTAVPMEWRENDRAINENISEKQQVVRKLSKSARTNANNLYDLITVKDPDVDKIKKILAKLEPKGAKSFSKKLDRAIKILGKTEKQGLKTFTKELIAAKKYLDKTIEGAKKIIKGNKVELKKDYEDVRSASKKAKYVGRLKARFYNVVPAIGITHLKKCEDKIISKGAKKLYSDVAALNKSVTGLPTVEAMEEATKSPEFLKKLAKIERTYKTLERRYEKIFDRKLSIDELKPMLSKEQAEAKLSKKIKDVMKKYENMDAKEFAKKFKSAGELKTAVRDDVYAYQKDLPFKYPKDPKQKLIVVVNGFRLEMPAISGWGESSWPEKIFNMSTDQAKKEIAKEKVKEKPKDIDTQLNEKLNHEQRGLRKLSANARNKAEALKTLITAEKPNVDNIKTALEENKKLSVTIGEEQSKHKEPATWLRNFVRELGASKSYLDQTIEGAEKVVANGKPQNANDFTGIKNAAVLSKLDARVVASIYSRVPPIGLATMKNCISESVKKGASDLREEVVKLYRESVSSGEVDGLKKALSDPTFQDKLAKLGKAYQKLKKEFEKELKQTLVDGQDKKA